MKPGLYAYHNFLVWVMPTFAASAKDYVKYINLAGPNLIAGALPITLLTNAKDVRTTRSQRYIAIKRVFHYGEHPKWE
jgi:hypothetical protein